MNFRFQIRLGESDVTTDPDCETFVTGKHCGNPVKIYEVEEIIQHPQYDIKSRYSHDVALIRLNDTIKFTGVFNLPFIFFVSFNTYWKSICTQLQPFKFLLVLMLNKVLKFFISLFHFKISISNE